MSSSNQPTPEDTPDGGPHAPVEAHEHHVDVGVAPPVRPTSTRRMARLAIGAVVLLVILFASAILPRRATDRALAADVVARDSAPIVNVTVVRRADTASALALPATIQAMHDGAIYARVSGYVTRWRADIGSVVKAGDVLAEIDAPELEQEVRQAESQLAQTHASLALARTELERMRALVRDSAATRQELDQRQAANDVAIATSNAAEANLKRLTETRRYTKVTAPFSGVITARGVDLGSFITAGGATSSPIAAGGGAPALATGSLFRLAQIDTVRAYINVPQAYAASITPGIVADIGVQELPGRTFTGRVVRTSRVLDAASRTLLAEVDIRNPGFALLPGMYAEVQLRFSRTSPPLVVPASALLIRADGPQVAVVDPAGPHGTAVIHLHAVQIGRDYGASIEIASGLPDGATVVINPSTELVDGGAVRVAKVAGADRAEGSVLPSAAVAGAPKR